MVVHAELLSTYCARNHEGMSKCDKETLRNVYLAIRNHAHLGDVPVTQDRVQYQRRRST